MRSLRYWISTARESNFKIKLFGVIIDENLNFNAHINYAISKAIRIFKNHCKFVRPTWGIHAENVTIIYRQVIEPTITYAAEIWGDAAQKQSAIRRLRSFQRSFAIRAIRGFHTVSAVSACALAQFMPLHLKIREVRDIGRVKRYGIYNGIPSDITLEIRVQPNDKLHPSQRQTITFKEARTQTDINIDHSNTRIFTDGSKSNDGVGAAFVSYLPNGRRVTRKFKLNNTCSVFQAELYAIKEALGWALLHGINDITLLTDSLSALKAIEYRSNDHNLVKTIHELLLRLKQTHRVEFIWVKAHVGIEGNESADTEAKKAIHLRTASVYHHFPLSYAKRLIRESYRHLWAEDYVNAEQGSGTRYWFPDLDSVSKFTEANETSFEMTQILTNHGYHKSYLERFKIVNNTHCPCDNNTPQTIEHLLKYCPKYANSRLHYASICNKLKAQYFDLVNNIGHKEVIKELNVFIKSIINTLKEFNSNDT
jgi:ribonuclease HI